MRVCLLLISDGREDYLRRTLESVEDKLPRFRSIVHVDDSEHRLGFAGAIAEGWRRVLETDADFVWHQEDDFLINRPVDVGAMATVLRTRPYLSQLALRRQPVGAEIAVGGFMAQRPGTYFEQTDGTHTWVEHRNFHTTNPSLYRTQLCTVGWPQGRDSEGHFGFGLREHGLPWGVSGPEVKHGFWGSMEDGKDFVTHIGDMRTGHGY